MISVSFVNVGFDQGASIDFSKRSIRLIFEGHSLFDAKGSDIVCAGVSALSQSVIKAVTVLTGIEQRIERSDAYLRSEIEIKELEGRESEFKLLLDTLIIGLFEIRTMYPENLSISFISDEN